VKPDLKPRWTKNALSLDGWMCRGSSCEGSLINVPIHAYLIFMTKTLGSVRFVLKKYYFYLAIMY